MIFQIKEKFWSLGDEFSITDEKGTLQYFVKGKAFSWGAKLSFQDANRKELAFIQQQLMSWKPCYQIMINGVLFAEMIKEFSWFKKKFTLDVPGPNDYTIEGSFWQKEFLFQRMGRTVATVSRKWALTDSYGVEMEDGEDPVAILCACVVIDQILDGERSS